MAPLNKARALVGVAKQTAKGTIAANPVFAHGVAGGKIIDYSLKQDFADVTSGTPAPANVDRTQADGGVGFDARGYIKAIGLYLLGLYGADTVTGAAPYIHTYGLADAQPYLTFFESYNALLRALRDVKVTGINFKWKGNEPVTVTPTGTGTVLSFPTTFTPGTDETNSEAFLVPVGGTFSLAMVGGAPATAVVTEGEIDIKFDTDTVFASGALEANDPGARNLMEATTKLTVVPDDLAYWMQTVTGASNGTAVAAAVQYGSLAVAFKENTGTGGLAISGAKVAFLCDYPEADPKGGSAQLALAGQAVMPSAGVAPLVPVLTNSQASY